MSRGIDDTSCRSVEHAISGTGPLASARRGAFAASEPVKGPVAAASVQAMAFRPRARLSWLAAAAVAAAAITAGCRGSAAGPSAPAAAGVRAYIAALKSNDPRDAYGLLAAPARKKVSYDEFALAWKQSEKERAWQAKVLEESLKGNPDVGERALISYSDGKLVQLEREGRAWRLDSELVSRSRARRPRDAIRLFADAIAARDISGVLGVLTQRRRDGLTKQVEGFVAGIGKRINDKIDEFGNDRAELRWDENGIRYRIVLRKEDDEWRIDDIYIRPAPKDEEGDRDREPDSEP
jgi:hypothetical protein